MGSDYIENKKADWFRGQTFPAAPSNTYIAAMVCSKGIVARSTAYALNDTAVVLAADSKYHLYKVTTAGTTAGSAPSYPGAENEAITDGTAVLTEQTAGLDAGTAQAEPTPGSLGYNRQAIPGALSSSSWSGTQSAGSTTASSGTGGAISNNAQVQFGPSSGAGWAPSPAMIWGLAVYDASTSGNLLNWGPLAAPTSVGAAPTTLTYAAGQIVMTES